MSSNSKSKRRGQQGQLGQQGQPRAGSAAKAARPVTPSSARPPVSGADVDADDRQDARDEESLVAPAPAPHADTSAQAHAHSSVAVAQPRTAEDWADGEGWADSTDSAVREAADAAAAVRTPNRTEELADVERTALPRPSARELLARAAHGAGRRVRSWTLEQWTWGAVLLLAAVLRFWGLGDKPLHHDESMHAYFSLQFALNPSSYSYNPLLHGPFQFHAEGLMMAVILFFQNIFVRGAVGNPWINDTTARFVPALFGIGIVALPIGLRRELGRLGALVASFLLAVSPAFVYFSRFLREDVYFNFFMFAMVVCAVRYARSRSTRAFIGLFASTILAYATFEGIYLSLVIFVGFLILLAVWELGSPIADRLPGTFTSRERILLARAGLFTLLGGVAALVAHFGLQWLNSLADAAADPKLQAQNDALVLNLENTSVAVLLYVSIFIALLVIGTLVWQMYRDDLLYRADDDLAALEAGTPEYDAALKRRAAAARALRLDHVLGAPARLVAALRDRLDPARQSFLRLALGVSWVQWFIAFVVAWMLFAVLYWALPGGTLFTGEPVLTWGAGFQRGVGMGIWQGLYYWLQQQHVARGGQPWYYYLLLIPLYEQLVCVFGLGGIVYSLFRPTRFRLFLIWWFLASLVLYSWAGEKMPWLTIHILLPLFLLAATVIAKLLQGCYAVVERLAANDVAALRARPWKPAVSVAGTALALLLLVPMIFGMLTLSQVDAANGPHEMMVYVQTTKDVQLVMNKIQAADQKLYGGQHLLRIGISDGMEWPFYWYLRDYQNAYFEYASTDPRPVDVIIAQPAGSKLGTDGQSWMAAHPTGWQMHEYQLRSWWSEDYKEKPCVPTARQRCPASTQFVTTGVGLGAYLTYGHTPPPGQPDFNLGRAAGNIWSWLWTRKAFGYTDGSTDFVFIVRNGLPITANP